MIVYRQVQADIKYAVNYDDDPDLDHAETLLVAEKTHRLRTLLCHIPGQADSECLCFDKTLTIDMLCNTVKGSIIS